MKQYDFFTAVANGMDGEVKAYAEAWLTKQNEKRAEKSAIHAEIDSAVLGELAQATEPVTASEITASIEDEDISLGKVVASCKRLVACGKVVKVGANPSQYTLA